MKNVLIIIGIIIAGIIIFLGVAYWHQQEQEAWCEWKKRSLCIPIEEKEIELGRKMTNKELHIYVDSFKENHGIVPPKPCPYCYGKYIINKYYGQER